MKNRITFTGKNEVSPIDLALNFTRTFQRYEHDHPAIREAMCLKTQYPAMLGEIRGGDLFAGRMVWPAVGFRLYSNPGFAGYYCDRSQIQAELDKKDLSAADRDFWTSIADYWSTRATSERINALDDSIARPGLAATVLRESTFPALPIGNYVYRVSGLSLDFNRLLKAGIPGMIAEVEKLAAAAEGDPDRLQVYQGMRIALDVLCDMCHHYAAQAEAQVEATPDLCRKEELRAMSQALEAITVGPPSTLAEAIQLFWLYVCLSHVDNFGRMDVYLADFYVSDINAGRLDEAQALVLLQALWRLIADEVNIWCGRVLIGGRGRPNEPAADRFALLAMEASKKVRRLLPQLTLRCYQGMNPAVWSKGLEVIGEGCVFPMLYNDDVLMDLVQNIFSVTREEAAQYVISDCGEMGLDHASIGFPDGNLILTQALVAALHNGMDPVSGRQVGLSTGTLESFATFEDLWSAYARQIEYFSGIVLERLAPMYQVQEREIRALSLAMLADDCLKLGQGFFSGVRYKGMLIEIYGTINTADSLTAIKQEVYERHTFTLPHLVQMVDADFVGFEKERLLLLRAPKYGNDNKVADAMAHRVYTNICASTKACQERLKLDFCLADLINAQGNVTTGKLTGALPDGRKAGMSLANANGPANGRDLQGPTALLNSLVKLRPVEIGGQSQHLKFNRGQFARSRAKLDALLKTYFANGGSQVSITVVDRSDLEKAMKTPENYGDLIVRIGGFCERFVSLPRDIQEDILARTLQD